MSRALLGLILLWYLALAAGYAVVTPRWNNPDEPAHYNYIRELARFERLPILRQGDWDAELLERQKAARFPDDAAIATIRYESHQPPLYYLIAATVYRSLGDAPIWQRVFALKALSVAIGATVVVAAYAAGRAVRPEHDDVALAAAAVVAFIPMNTAISAAINNDVLANALAAITVVFLLVGLRRGFDDRGAIGLGFLLGALLLTKLTVYVYVGLALGVVWWVERREAIPTDPPRWWQPPRRAALAAAAAASISAWWFARGILVYGWTDPLGLVRHDAVVVGQPRWAAYDLDSLGFFLRTLFQSFWGQFGWMGIVLDGRIYMLYGVLSAAALAGLVYMLVRAWRTVRRTDPSAEAEAGDGQSEVGIEWLQIGVLSAAFALVLGEVVVYNLRYIQAQGRYLFPALAPIAIGLACGWHRLATLLPLPATMAQPARRAALAAIVAMLVIANLVGLVRYVAPSFR